MSLFCFSLNFLFMCEMFCLLLRLKPFTEQVPHGSHASPSRSQRTTQPGTRHLDRAAWARPPPLLSTAGCAASPLPSFSCFSASSLWFVSPLPSRSLAFHAASELPVVQQEKESAASEWRVCVCVRAVICRDCFLNVSSQNDEQTRPDCEDI